MLALHRLAPFPCTASEFLSTHCHLSSFELNPLHHSALKASQEALETQTAVVDAELVAAVAAVDAVETQLLQLGITLPECVSRMHACVLGGFYWSDRRLCGVQRQRAALAAPACKQSGSARLPDSDKTAFPAATPTPAGPAHRARGTPSCSPCRPSGAGQGRRLPRPFPLCSPPQGIRSRQRLRPRMTAAVAAAAAVAAEVRQA